MEKQSNWSKGQRGFQSSLNQDQQHLLLKVLVANAWSRKAAREFLDSRYGIKLAERTLTGYISRLRKRWKKVSRDIDHPVDWSDFVSIEKNGIPQRHIKNLYAWWMEIKSACIETGVLPVTPTYRSVKWWAFVLEYHAEDLESNFDRQLIAEEYASREIQAEFLEQKMNVDDLEMWLFNRPWESYEKMNIYKSKVKSGQFVGLSLAKSAAILGDMDDVSVEAQRKLTLHLMYGGLFEFAPEPYGLPSESLMHHWEEIVTTIEQSRKNSGGSKKWEED